MTSWYQKPGFGLTSKPILRKETENERIAREKRERNERRREASEAYHKQLQVLIRNNIPKVGSDGIETSIAAQTKKRELNTKLTNDHKFLANRLYNIGVKIDPLTNYQYNKFPINQSNNIMKLKEKRRLLRHIRHLYINKIKTNNPNDDGKRILSTVETALRLKILLKNIATQTALTNIKENQLVNNTLQDLVYPADLTNILTIKELFDDLEATYNILKMISYEIKYIDDKRTNAKYLVYTEEYKSILNLLKTKYEKELKLRANILSNRITLLCKLFKTFGTKTFEFHNPPAVVAVGPPPPPPPPPRRRDLSLFKLINGSSPTHAHLNVTNQALYTSVSVNGIRTRANGDATTVKTGIDTDLTNQNGAFNNVNSNVKKAISDARYVLYKPNGLGETKIDNINTAFTSANNALTAATAIVTMAKTTSDRLLDKNLSNEISKAAMEVAKAAKDIIMARIMALPAGVADAAGTPLEPARSNIILKTNVDPITGTIKNAVNTANRNRINPAKSAANIIAYVTTAVGNMNTIVRYAADAATTGITGLPTPGATATALINAANKIKEAATRANNLCNKIREMANTKASIAKSSAILDIKSKTDVDILIGNQENLATLRFIFLILLTQFLTYYGFYNDQNEKVSPFVNGKSINTLKTAANRKTALQDRVINPAPNNTTYLQNIKSDLQEYKDLLNKFNDGVALPIHPLNQSFNNLEMAVNSMLQMDIRLNNCVYDAGLNKYGRTTAAVPDEKVVNANGLVTELVTSRDALFNAQKAAITEAKINDFLTAKNEFERAYSNTRRTNPLTIQGENSCAHGTFKQQCRNKISLRHIRNPLTSEKFNKGYKAHALATKIAVNAAINNNTNLA